MNKLYFSTLKYIVLPVFLIFFNHSFLHSQTVQITGNIPGQSANIVVGPNLYHVSESIYTEAEIGATNFTTAATAINHIDFNVFQIGLDSTIENFNIYLREVPLDSQVFTIGTTYSTAGYTLVFSGTYKADVLGWVGMDLSTNFVRTSGKNLMMLIERLDGVLHTPSVSSTVNRYTFRSANGNNTDATIRTSRRENLATLPVPGTTTLNTNSAARPQIRLRHLFPNDAAINQVYTLGSLPIPYATPHVISASISNNGSLTLTNLNVSLNVTGANTFTDAQTIASLAPGATATVAFAAFSPINTGNNSVSVSIPSDDFNGDNTITIPQTVTVNTYNYAFGPVPSGSVGVINSNTGDFVAKFTTSSPTSVNQVGVNFTAGGQPFKIGIWDKSGNGIPGNLLWESTTQITTLGLFTLPVSPPVAVTDTFYVGVKQIGTTNIQFAYQNETPIRPNTFFRTVPTGSNNWLDFYPGNPFKFMVEPRLTIANDVGVSTINYPVANKTVDNCGLIPKAVISNYGSNNQTSPFDVTFKIRQAGAVVYSDIKQVSLNSGVSQEISFAPFSSSISGADSSFCYTGLATDGANNNDTLVNAFTTGDFYNYGGGAVANGGYRFANSTTCASPSTFQPTYNWINQTSTEINWNTNGDDSVLATPITLPFTFKYFGTDYNQFWICSNGWISFSNAASLSPSIQKSTVLIPSAGGIENYIAGYLSDLDLTTGTYTDAHTYYGGDATQFIITFLHAHLKNSPEYISFQIILKQDGNIFIQYNDAETTIPVTSLILNNGEIGIENASGSQGILYRILGNYGPMFGSPLVVQFKPPSAVPVTLLHFSAVRIRQINKLNWSTSQEINSGYFIVERSNDGIRFNTIGKVTAAGNSNSTLIYSYTDNAPVKGINYYRLKIVDVDNDVKYSETKKIRNVGTADVTVSPNPIKELMRISISADKKGPAMISISDNSGKIVYSKSATLSEGLNSLEINAAYFSVGMYTIRIQLSDDVIVKKVNKL